MKDIITNPNDSSIIQGTIGRLTGYDDNGISICYTNIQSIDMYEKLWENEFIFSEGIEWNTNTTKYNKIDNITYSTGTFNSVKNIKELKDNCSEKVKEKINIKYEIYDNWEDLKKGVLN